MMRSGSRLVLALLAATVAAGLLGCSGGGSGTSAGDFVQSGVVVRLTSGTALRGLTLTLTTAVDFTVVAVEPRDPPLSTASCQANIGDADVVAACVSTTSFAAPLDAW